MSCCRQLVLRSSHTAVRVSGTQFNRLAKDQVTAATEFVVCGFTEGKGSRKHLGALLRGQEQLPPRRLPLTSSPCKCRGLRTIRLRWWWAVVGLVIAMGVERFCVWSVPYLAKFSKTQDQTKTPGKPRLTTRTVNPIANPGFELLVLSWMRTLRSRLGQRSLTRAAPAVISRHWRLPSRCPF